MKKLALIYRIPGDILISLCMLVFGLLLVFIKILGDINPFSLLFSFQCVAAVSFFSVLLWNGFEHISARAWKLLALLAFVALGNDLAYFFALRLTLGATAAVGHQTVSLYLLFLAPIFLREKTKRSEWMALWVSLLGVLILYGKDLTQQRWEDIWGITLGLLSAPFYAMLIILYRLLPKEDISTITINFWRHLIGMIVLIPFLFALNAVPYTSKQIIILVVFGGCFTLASGIHNFAISRTRTLHSSIIGKSEPVLVAFFSFLFLREIPGPQTLIGGTLIIAASVWLACQKEQ